MPGALQDQGRCVRQWQQTRFRCTGLHKPRSSDQKPRLILPVDGVHLTGRDVSLEEAVHENGTERLQISLNWRERSALRQGLLLGKKFLMAPRPLRAVLVVVLPAQNMRCSVGVPLDGPEQCWMVP